MKFHLFVVHIGQSLRTVTHILDHFQILGLLVLRNFYGTKEIRATPGVDRAGPNDDVRLTVNLFATRCVHGNRILQKQDDYI